MKYVLAMVVVVLAGLVAATWIGDQAARSADEGVNGTGGAESAATGPQDPGPGADTSKVSGEQPEAVPTRPGKDPEYAAAFKEPEDLLKDRLGDVITWLVTGEKTAADKTDLERTLILVMEEERLGDAFTRSETARRSVESLLQQLERYMPKSGLKRTSVSPQQRSFIAAMADQLALDIRRKEPKAGGRQHTGALLGAIDYDAPKGHAKVRWDVIGGFEYVDHMKLPDAVTALNGKKVAVAGYMITLGEVEDIHEFLLVESGWSCCFGTPPDVNQVIEVRIPEDKPGVEFTTTPIAVTGVMEVGEEVEDGFVISVYRINAETVVDVE